MSVGTTVESGVRGGFLAAALACWPLWLALAAMVVGHGLLGSLLGVRLTLEGYPAGTAGLVMSGFFVGIVAAGLLAPRLIGAVGHIRVFAAMAGLSLVCALLHSLWVEPVSWSLLRAVNGFATTSMYIVVESWVNDRAANTFRGRLLSVYMLIWLSAMSGGMLLLDAADPAGMVLFALVAICFGLSIVPLALGARSAPEYSAPERVSLRRLWQASPLGSIGAAMVGLIHGTLTGMVSVYAATAGLPTDRVALLTAAIFLGGLLLQMPIGRLSDRCDRRLVLAGVALLAALAAGAAIWLRDLSFWAEIAAIALLGGLCFPLYTLTLSVTNDRIGQREMVGASATFYLLLGIGAVIGPPIAGFMMQSLGAGGFYLYLSALLLLMAAFAAWRRGRRPSPPQTAEALPALPVAPPPSQV